MKAVYIAHPLRGKSGSPEEIRANLERIDEIVKNLAAIYPDVLLLSPIHAFGYYDPQGDQKQVLAQCAALLGLADELWVFGDWESSQGCRMEMRLAEKCGITMRIMENGKEEEQCWTKS